MIDANKYEISTKSVLIDGDVLFEARVRELPDVCEYAETRVEAIDLAIDTIETTAIMLAEQGRAMPEPVARDSHDYSGRMTLRIPKFLHRSLAIEAQTDEISLNSYVSSLISLNHGRLQEIRMLADKQRSVNLYTEITSFTINSAAYDSGKWFMGNPEYLRTMLPMLEVTNTRELMA